MWERVVKRWQTNLNGNGDSNKETIKALGWAIFATDYDGYLYLCKQLEPVAAKKDTNMWVEQMAVHVLDAVKEYYFLKEKYNE